MAWSREAHDLYLSDVHVCNKTHPFEDRYLSRFFFKFPSKLIDCNESEDIILKQEDDGKEVFKDEDGDFDIDSSVIHSPLIQDRSTPREGHLKEAEDKTSRQEVITLEHMMETSLHDVGYQVWPGALLLCDYLLHYRDSSREEVVLDLGAGTGLTSIIAALCTKRVICTDYCSEILELAQRNWIRNQALLPILAKPADMEFVVLDWTENYLSSDGEFESSETSSPDKQLLHSATLIIAAEAVYDDDLTDACFRTIYHLLTKSPEKAVLMAVEKRIVFSSVSHDVCSPAYEHFMENLEDLSSVDKGDISFTYRQIPVGLHDLPQYFMYTRTKELELWRISSKFKSRSPEISAGT